MMFSNAPGFFCASTGKAAPSGPCSGGYYCTSGARSPTPEDGGASGGSCPEGHYCPQGSSAPLPCPTGYYNNKNRSSRLTDCLTCPAGIGSFPLCLFMYSCIFESLCTQSSHEVHNYITSVLGSKTFHKRYHYILIMGDLAYTKKLFIAEDRLL